MLCGQQTACKYSAGELRAGRLWCKRWSCEDCRPRRLRELRKKAAAGNPSTLITLTIDPKKHRDPDIAAQKLVRAWRNIVQRAVREGLADHIQYLAVFEETRKGWPHLHVLARCPFIPQQWLSERMTEYAESPIVDIRAVYNKRHASRYIAKYVSKGPGRFTRCKRYWSSRLWAPSADQERPVADAKDRGWITPTGIEELAAEIHKSGWSVMVENENSFVAAPTGRATWLWSWIPPPTPKWRKSWLLSAAFPYD